MNWTFTIFDCLFFLITAFPVAYLLLFAVASTRKSRCSYPVCCKKHRFAVMFPAYKEDNVILSSVKSFLKQDYPCEAYDVIVISDKMRTDTDRELESLPIVLLKVDFENSSKAKALKFAVDKLDPDAYDGIIILDADNLVEKDFLLRINDAFGLSCKAIQAHRKAKNLDTDTAVLDALSEEINNSIFRKGHARMGLSSALIGSGMAFRYSWFKENIRHVHTAGEDKELEALLLEQGIFIHYLENVSVYDEKIRKEEAFKNQRLRWLAAQFESFARTVRQLPDAIRRGNIDFCDKILQMIMPPRIVLLLVIVLFACMTSIIHPSLSVKWWILFAGFATALFLAIPSYLPLKKICRASRKIPALGMIMLFNMFKVRKAGKQFIHTSHGETDNL